MLCHLSIVVIYKSTSIICLEKFLFQSFDLLFTKVHWKRKKKYKITFNDKSISS